MLSQVLMKSLRSADGEDRPSGKARERSGRGGRWNDLAARTAWIHKGGEVHARSLHRTPSRR